MLKYLVLSLVFVGALAQDSVDPSDGSNALLDTIADSEWKAIDEIQLEGPAAKMKPDAQGEAGPAAHTKPDAEGDAGPAADTKPDAEGDAGPAAHTKPNAVDAGPAADTNSDAKAQKREGKNSDDVKSGSVSSGKNEENKEVKKELKTFKKEVKEVKKDAEKEIGKELKNELKTKATLTTKAKKELTKQVTKEVTKETKKEVEKDLKKTIQKAPFKNGAASPQKLKLLPGRLCFDKMSICWVYKKRGHCKPGAVLYGMMRRSCPLTCGCKGYATHAPVDWYMGQNYGGKIGAANYKEAVTNSMSREQRQARAKVANKGVHSKEYIDAMSTPFAGASRQGGCKARGLDIESTRWVTRNMMERGLMSFECLASRKLVDTVAKMVPFAGTKGDPKWRIMDPYKCFDTKCKGYDECASKEKRGKARRWIHPEATKIQQCFPFSSRKGRLQKSFIHCPCHDPSVKSHKKPMSSMKAMRIILGQLTMVEFTGAIKPSEKPACKRGSSKYSKAHCNALKSFDRAVARMISGNAATIMLKCWQGNCKAKASEDDLQDARAAHAALATTRGDGLEELLDNSVDAAAGWDCG